MAAAAFNDDSDKIVQQIQRKLARLQSRCQSPRSLEENVDRALADARDLAVAVRSYQRTALPPAGRAARDMQQNLEDCLEAFSEFAQLRKDHTDAEHLRDRVGMAQFVRTAIEAMIGYFDAL